MSDLKSDALASPLENVETPLLAVAVPEGRGVPASLAALDQAAGGVLARATGDFNRTSPPRDSIARGLPSF